MKIKIFIVFVLIYTFLFNEVFASILFFDILPNTENDKILEYIEIYNSWSIDKSLSWFILKDKSGKEFIFWSWDILLAWKTKKYFRDATKILLNNTNEELYLYDNSWSLIDNFSYTWSSKWKVIQIIKTGTWVLENNISNWNIKTNTWIIYNTWSIESTWSNEINSDISSVNWTWVIDNNTWSIEWVWNINSDTWNIIDTNTWLVVNNTWSILEEIENNFELKFSFQNPSYILEKNKIKEKYICDNSKKNCKINLDLRNSFTWNFKEKDYDCSIDFWFDWWKSWEENKCNPWTIIFPKWYYDIKFRIIEKSNSWNIFTWWFVLENKIEPEIIEKEIIKEVEVEKIVEKNICKNEWEILDDLSIQKEKIENKINIEKPEILIQSWLDENNNCKKLVCSVNLKYEEKDKLERCEWEFYWWSFKWNTDKKCNPWYVKYWIWNYKIKLKVFEKDNENNFKESILEIKNFKKEKSVNKKNSIDFKKEDKGDLDNKLLEEDNKNIQKEINKNNILRFIKLWDLNINPKWRDDNEYIEIKNLSSSWIFMWWCSLDDKLDWWSKKYVFENDFILEKNKSIKIYKKQSKIILNNSKDEVNLICNWNIVDNLKWDFSIKEDYILNREKLIVREKINEINDILKVKNISKKENINLVNSENNNKNKSIKIISDEIKIKEKLNANISIQGKIWTNKILNWNKITCLESCSINFDWSKSSWNIKKYLWDFWNWKKYEWKNPWYIKYEKLWKYSVILTTIDENWLKNKTNFLVNFEKTPKKIKPSVAKSKEKNNDFNEIKNEDKSDLYINKTEIKEKKDMTKVEILLYVLIFVFSLNLIVLVLRREKLI